MKKTILRIIGCLLNVAIAFGISWLVGQGIPPNAEPTPNTPAHTHEFGEWTEMLVATCTNPGQARRICSCGEFEEKELPALGHAFVDWQQTLSPTCTEPGRESRTCVCGLCEEREVAVLGHDFVDGICSRCREIEPDYIPPCSHSNTQNETKLAETCTSTGVRDVYCKDCGEFLRTETIPKHEHTTYYVATSEATCTSGGIKKQYCSECKQLIDTIETKALGHDYVDAKCSRCGSYDPSVYSLTASMKSKSGEYVVSANNTTTYAKLVWQASSESIALAGGGNDTVYFGAIFTRDGKTKTIGKRMDTFFRPTVYTVSSITMDLTSEYSDFFINGEYTVQFKLGNLYSNKIKFTYNKNNAYWFTVVTT